MPYATVDDMTLRFGQVEMIRLTNPQGQDMDTVNLAVVDQALADASDLIDTYCAKRYTTPIAVPPNSIVRTACVLARYDLASGGDGVQPSETVRLARKEAIEWLTGINAGKFNLPLDEVVAGDQSNAQMSDRGAVFGPGCDVNIVSGNAPYPNSDPGGLLSEAVVDPFLLDDVDVGLPSGSLIP